MTMLVSLFDLGIPYSFVSVFNPDLEYPFNDWLDQHCSQGFTWRPESVSFGTLNSSTRLKIEVCVANEVELKADTIRAIAVPFLVTSSRGVVIPDASYSFSTPDITIPITTGKYIIVFETGFREEYRSDPNYQGRLVALLPTWCRFTFIPRESVDAEILRADSNLSPTYPLLMEAKPA